MAPKVQLQEITSGEDLKCPGIDIVFIHGMVMLDVLTESTRWHTTLPTLAPKNSRIFGYDLKTRVDEQFRWQSLGTKSLDLVESVYELHKASKDLPRPIVFLCYGLGGVVAKQALWKASQQFNRFRDLIEVVSGIMFLATPHITKSDPAATQAFSLILRSDLMQSSKRVFSQADMSTLAYAALQFEELDSQVPILSCYETQETRLRGPLWLSKRLILVDQKMARVSARHEKVIGIDTELNRIFDNTDAIIHLHISRFLQDVLRDAPDRIKDVLNPTCTGLKAPRSALRSMSSIKSRRRASDNISSGQLSPETSTPKSPPISPPHSFKTESSYEIIPKASDFTSLRPQVKLPCYHTRPHSMLNSDFHGRDDVLEKIDHIFLREPLSSPFSERKSLKTFVICGLGGIGKTQTAVQYIFTRKKQFDAIFWLQADESGKLANGFSQIAVHLGLEAGDILSDPVVSRELVKGWLANPVKSDQPFDKSLARWLLVFDNADKPDIIHDFWPQDGQGCILITSRDPILRTNVYFGENGIDLGTLQPSEAASLLRKLTQRGNESGSDQILLDIVNRLDYFPLAIIQMAGIIRRSSMSLPEFLDLYNHEVDQGDLHHLRVGPQQGYSYTMATVWALEKLGPGATQILSVLALLDPDCIQEQILTTIQEPKLPHFPATKGSYLRDLTELLQSSIVQRNPDYNELSIHRVVQDVVKAKLRKTAGLLSNVLTATVRMISSVWPFVSTPQIGYPAYDKVDRWGQCEKLCPHILHLKQAYEAMSENDRRSVADEPLAWLFAEVAWYHQERSNPKECLEFVDATLLVCEFSAYPMRDILAEIHGTRGIVAMEINQPEEALQHIEAHMILRLQALEETGILTAKLAAGYSELARALMINGLFEQAEEKLAKSVEIRRKLDKFTMLQLFSTLRGQALIEWQRGNHEEAIELLSQALRDRQLAFGRDDREGGRTGSLLYFLGAVRSSQGFMQESFAYHQRALLQYRSTLGDSHFHTAEACYQLAIHHIRFNDHESAMKLLEQAFKIYNRGTFYAPELARTQYMTGVVLSLMNSPHSCGAAFAKAWEIRRRLVPGDLRSASELQQADYDELVVFWASF